MEMTPIIVGPGAYASPDPATNMGRLRDIESHPLAAEISEDYGADLKGAVVSPGENHPNEPADVDLDSQGSASASYEEQTKEELLALAGDREIEGRSSMSKSELVEAHEAYDEARASAGPDANDE